MTLSKNVADVKIVGLVESSLFWEDVVSAEISVVDLVVNKSVVPGNGRFRREGRLWFVL